MSATKFLTIRNVEENVARAFAAGAAIRGITQAEYLDRLIQLRQVAAVAARIDPALPRSDERLLEFAKAFAESVASLELGDKFA